MNRNTFANGAVACRWIGRTVGTLLVFVITVIAIGQGLPNPLTQPLGVQFGFLALALMLMGMLAGWRWELPGGIMSLFGWCLFLAAVMRSPRGLNWFVISLALPGGLYLASALLRRNQAKPKSA